MPHFLTRKTQEQRSLRVLLLPPKVTAGGGSKPGPHSLSSWVIWSSQRLLRSFLPFHKAVFLWYKAITGLWGSWAAKLLVLHRSPQMCSSDKESTAEVLSHCKWDYKHEDNRNLTAELPMSVGDALCILLYVPSEPAWARWAELLVSLDRQATGAVFEFSLSPPFFSFSGWKAQFHLDAPLFSRSRPSTGLENEHLLFCFIFPRLLWVFGRELLKAVLQT